MVGFQCSQVAAFDAAVALALVNDVSMVLVDPVEQAAESFFGEAGFFKQDSHPIAVADY